MFKALLRGLGWGTTDTAEAETTVTETEFESAMAMRLQLGPDFLTKMPYAKIRYRLQSGNHAGKSFLWVMARDAAIGNDIPIKKVIAHVSLEDLRTHPLKGNDSSIKYETKKTVLWLLCYAALMGRIEPLLAVLKKWGKQLTEEDLNQQSKGKSVRMLLGNLLDRVDIKEYLPEAFFDPTTSSIPLSLLDEDENTCDSIISLGEDPISEDNSSEEKTYHSQDATTAAENESNDDDDNDKIPTITRQLSSMSLNVKEITPAFDARKQRRLDLKNQKKQQNQSIPKPTGPAPAAPAAQSSSTLSPRALTSSDLPFKMMSPRSKGHSEKGRKLTPR